MPTEGLLDAFLGWIRGPWEFEAKDGEAAEAGGGAQPMVSRSGAGLPCRATRIWAWLRSQGSQAGGLCAQGMAPGPTEL